MRYLIMLKHEKNWLNDVVLHHQPYMPEHAVYVQEEYNKGRIVLFKMSKYENINPQFDEDYIDYKHKIQKELGIIG